MSNFEIATMPIVERLQLMEVLWDSMSSEKSGGELNIPTWHRDVLAERVRLLDNGEESVSNWADAKKRIRTQAEGQ